MGCLPQAGKSIDRDDHTFHLFVREKDAKAEQWDGVRSGTRAALDVFNADEVWKGSSGNKKCCWRCSKTGDINQISSLLAPIVQEASKIYTDLISEPKNKSFFSRFLYDQSPKVEGLAKVLKSSNTLPLKDVLNGFRNLKSDAEIANMRKAGQASGRAYTGAMRRAWEKEKDLAAYLDYRFRTRGCDCSAYIPVVAGGQVRFIPCWFIDCAADLARTPALFTTPRTIISWSKTPVPTHSSSTLTLVQRWPDGASRRRWRRLLHLHWLTPTFLNSLQECGGYITDITRTWPVSGTFTPAQKDLYNAVLTTQRHCISLCRANAKVSLDELHNIAGTALTDQLKQLGFDTSGNVCILRIKPLRTLPVLTRRPIDQALDALFPHHLGHYIGLDVHDTPGQSRKTKLQSRQCVTIEP